MRAVKKRWALIGGILAFFALAIVFLLNVTRLAPEKRIKAETISKYMENGDIICRLGDRLWSLYFKDISITDKRFSHCGIVRIVNNKITVINAEGRAIQGEDFVNEVDLDDFLKIAKAIGIYRINNHDGNLVSNTALEYKGRQFDWNWDLQDDSKIYCTELLYVILKKIAPEIELQTVYLKEIGKDIIPVEAFSNSPHFKEILYIRADGAEASEI